jgi:hypothetical protein
MAIAKLNLFSSPKAWGDGSLPRKGFKTTRTLNSEFRTVKSPKLEHKKWGSEGCVVCQNETQNEKLSSGSVDNLLNEYEG